MSYGPRTALVDASGRRITYTDLDRMTDALAAGLLGAGARPGETSVWLSGNCLEYLIAYFATAKAGLAFSPLNYWLRPAELEGLVDLVAPSVVFAGREWTDVLDAMPAVGAARSRVVLGGAATGWTGWDEVLTGPGSLDGVPDDENALHEIVFTSGTTGASKGVMRSQRGRILDSVFSALAFEVRRSENLVFCGPQFHIGGASVPNQVLVQGGTATIVAFEPEVVGAAIAGGASYMIGVPAHYHLLFDSGVLEKIDTTRMRGCYVGGSVASKALFGSISDHFPAADLVQGYGSTESGPHTLALRGQDFLDHYGTLGLPVPGTEVRVVDPAEAARELPAGEIGELLVRSDSVMSGYFRRDDLTAAVLSADGWLRTGDLVSRDEQGFFTLAGRAKEMIISGGENVYPKEVEDVLSEHPAVAEVAVIGIPDPVYEERVLALVRRSGDATGTTGEELRQFVRARLAGFKTPKDVHFVDDFPRTGMGKIAKGELAQQYGTVFDA
ncbi:class I adenylate-forming enzyme family protein [Nakamurella alba]|uniref:class I adenylate-forming enzyme family protein n=1 Tax=Nakamurella alba TaxID=2665158 RepID=UPI0018AB5B4F|nr:class I adenylate-forming enzyme family protein [Nakamurella alba]